MVANAVDVIRGRAKVAALQIPPNTAHQAAVTAGPLLYHLAMPIRLHAKLALFDVGVPMPRAYHAGAVEGVDTDGEACLMIRYRTPI